MTTVHRIEVRPAPGAADPKGQAILRDARALGYCIEAVRTGRIYLIQGALSDPQLKTLCSDLLVDPLVEQGQLGTQPAAAGSSLIEVHPLAGVMDPAAQSVCAAISALVGIEARVSTGWRYDLAGLEPDQARQLAQRLLANPVVHGIHDEPVCPDELPAGAPWTCQSTEVPIRQLDDDALSRLSREGHLFLSLDEMHAIRAHFRSLGREPTEIELETLAQTWSEHCVHKTLKSTIRYRPHADDVIDWSGRPGHTILDDGTVLIENLLASTVAAATHELIADGLDWTLSVFVDNAGIIAFDDELAVCVKVETHNHPSAIEPYGGAATGIGGCIRDIIGTGLAARPIASIDVFCVAPPDIAEIPVGCIDPGRILREVVAGVRDYGNRVGIPTLNGAVWFDDRYIGNPLVFCGCVGVMPRDLITGDPRPGDLIVTLGGRTGRDGIHGATFSSAELTDTHADEFSHAVQIGNPIEEKRTLDAILRARDADGGPLFSSITDCGAGGFSSAVGEMGEQIGADVQLDKAPLKYDGLSATEIWISEAQERMVLAVPTGNLDRLQTICDEEHVELAVLGTFGTRDRELILHYGDFEVGRLPMELLHDGIPTPTRTASWSPSAPPPIDARTPKATPEVLLDLLAHPNIASKHWIIRQYDHEVQGNTIVKPLVGPGGRGPGDAAVIEPNPGTGRGLAIACGLATGIGDPALGGDPYLMALAAIDECVRNLVCVGADPARIAILDNFCWPSCDDEASLGSLVRAAEGCYDGAKAYRTPFVSGKDSLNNQFTTEAGTTIRIPPTLLISGIGIVADIGRVVTSDAKKPGNVLIVVGPESSALGGSHLQRIGAMPADADARMPRVDLELGPVVAKRVAELIDRGLVRSAHDVSDGGLLVAVGEMLIAGSTPQAPIGADLLEIPDGLEGAFSEGPSRFVLEIEPGTLDRAKTMLGAVPWRVLGTLTDSGVLGHAGSWELGVEDLAKAWRGTLDW